MSSQEGSDDESIYSDYASYDERKRKRRIADGNDGFFASDAKFSFLPSLVEILQFPYCDVKNRKSEHCSDKDLRNANLKDKGKGQHHFTPTLMTRAFYETEKALAVICTQMDAKFSNPILQISVCIELNFEPM